LAPRHITYFSLVLGELVPKQIALRDPEKIAVVAPAMTVMARIASPIVSFLDGTGRAVLRALGYEAQPKHRVTDEEIQTLMAEAETAGVLEPGERAMIAGVMRLGDRPVRAIMTPRREVDMVDLSTDPDDIRRTIVESIHSRLPVHAGTREEMLGVVQAKDLLDAYLRGDCPDIRAHVRPAPNVPDTADALDVLDVIKGSPVHMALVHDEYGQFEGIVTNADILEAIAGAFRTDEGSVELEAVRPFTSKHSAGSWKLTATPFCKKASENRSRLAGGKLVCKQWTLTSVAANPCSSKKFSLIRPGPVERHTGRHSLYWLEVESAFASVVAGVRRMKQGLRSVP
jgi:putative hemolysin